MDEVKRNACRTCRYLHSSLYYGNNNRCSHSSCYEQEFDPLRGEYSKRILDYNVKNADGYCTDFKEKKVPTSIITVKGKRVKKWWHNFIMRYRKDECD
jgi:hypothetical protein